MDKEDDTPLHCAVGAGHLDVADALLKYGADVNARNADGNTPVHIACQQNNEDALVVLLDRPGVDLNVKNFEGLTALGEARMNNHINIVQIIEDRFKQNIEETLREPPKRTDQIDWQKRRDPTSNKVCVLFDGHATHHQGDVLFFFLCTPKVVLSFVAGFLRECDN